MTISISKQTAWFLVALAAGILVAVALMSGMRFGNHVTLCQSDDATCYSDGQTISDHDLRAAHLELSSGWIGNFTATEAVYRLYDDQGNSVDAGNLSLDMSGSNEYFGMGALMKDMFGGPLQRGKTYTLTVTYGSILGAAGSEIGQTTFTYGG